MNRMRASLMDEGLRDGTKQMGFPAARGPEGEHIFRAVEEGAVHKGCDEGVLGCGQSCAVKHLQAFLQRQLRLA